MTGRALWVPPLVQLLIGSLQPLVVFLLGRRLVNERAALLAAGLAGLFTTRPRGPNALLLLYVATQLVALMSATVLGRYRLALAAAPMIYAGAALLGLWHTLRQRQFRAAGRGAPAAVVSPSGDTDA